MFEHLPVVTDADVEKMADDWLHYCLLMIENMKGDNTLDEAINSTCVELSSREMLRAVRGCVFGILGLFEDRGEPERSGAAMTAVPTVLAVLCLIDRALEAQGVE